MTWLLFVLIVGSWALLDTLLNPPSSNLRQAVHVLLSAYLVATALAELGWLR